MQPTLFGSKLAESEKLLASNGEAAGSNKTSRISKLPLIQQERRRAWKRDWYKKNKDRIRDQQRAQNHRSYHKHIEKRRAAGRAYTRKLYETQPEEMRRRNRENSRIWRAKNPKRKSELSRRFQLKAMYGLTVEAWDALLARQNGVCAICHKTDSTSRLSVDHDHATGKIRGLLCRGCNVALGKFSDSTAVLQRAINYLTK